MSDQIAKNESKDVDALDKMLAILKNAGEEKRNANYDATAGQAAVDLFHKENNILKELIANATESPDLLKALKARRDQCIRIALTGLSTKQKLCTKQCVRK
jgi:hypothetical protein